MTLESPALLIFILFLAAVAVLLVRQGRAKPGAKDSRPTVTPTPPPTVIAPPPPVAPVAVTAPTAPAAPAAPQDDRPVTTLKGLGPKVAARLGELGIATVGDLAALSDAAAADLDAQLGSFQGRMARDRWIEQARLLATGDIAGFEAAFGKLGG